MLCLHFSVTAVNGTVATHGIREDVVKDRGERDQPGCQVPALVSPPSHGVTASGAGLRQAMATPRGARLPRAGAPGGGTAGDPPDRCSYVEVCEARKGQRGTAKGERGMAKGETSQPAGEDGSEDTGQGEGHKLRSGARGDSSPDSKAGESAADHSGYDTAVCSDIYESFSDCAESPLHTTADGQERSAGGNVDLRPSLGSQLDGRSQLLLNTRQGSSNVLLWDHCQPCDNDETHYITTHEIQLYELDHDGDCELEMGPSWDVEESSVLYSFAENSSVESDASEEGSQTPQGTSHAGGDQPPVSSETTGQETVGGHGAPGGGECVCPRGSLSKSQDGNGSSAGHIHLSIRATSRAVSQNSNVQEKGDPNRANSEGESNQRLWKRSECLSKRQLAEDCASGDKGTVHAGVGGKANSKRFDYSSGASSAVSELDDADKEVRTLTARSFRSLACPGAEYLDTYCADYRTSTDVSSLPEDKVGLNRRAACVDMKCRSAAEKKDRVEFPGKSANFSIGQKRDGPPRSRGDQQVASSGWEKLPVNGKEENSAGAAENQTFAKRQIQLSGKFEQIGSRVITLTETLNFSYDVKEHIQGARGDGRRLKFARNAAGSHCADEVTDAAPKEEGSEPCKETCKAADAMEGTQKKSKFASSLLQNVIWKKMQYEQELKMERGEITDTSFAGRTSPSVNPAEFSKAAPREAEPAVGDLQRPNSGQASGGSSEGSPVPREIVAEAQKVTAGGSVAGADENFSARSDVRAAACDPEKGAGVAEASRGTLPRSQHSAFRSWRDSDLETHKVQKSEERNAKQDRRVRAEIGGQPVCKQTKMSHLFVPSIQKVSKGSDPAPTGSVLNVKCATRPHEGRPSVKGASYSQRGDEGDATSGVVTSRSPEIKIRLRSARDNEHSPFSIAKLLTPNIGRNAAGVVKSADDSKCQALSASFIEESLRIDCTEDNKPKVPQFTVRDIRDNIHKLQAPIHQVRDVRKLVKSSYHILTLDGSNLNQLKANDRVPSKKAGSLLPIVIKCQSVSRKDLADGGRTRLAECVSDEEWTIFSKDCGSPTPEAGMKNGSVFVHRASGRIPLKEAASSSSSTAAAGGGGGGGGGTSANASPPSAATSGDKRSAGRKVAGNQLALEKLTAAVKTMEQLYVFDKNEWKRKTEPAPGPLVGSHVLSLITSEEASCSCSLERGGAGEQEARAAGRDSIWNAEQEARAAGRDSIWNAEQEARAAGRDSIWNAERGGGAGEQEARAPGRDSIWNAEQEARAAGRDSIWNASSSAQSREPAKPSSSSSKGAGGKSIAPQLFTVSPVVPQPPPFNVSAKVTSTTTTSSSSSSSSSRKGLLMGAKSPQPPDFRSFRAQRSKSLEESEKQFNPGAAMQTSAAEDKSSQPPPPPEYENYLTIPIKKPAAPREPPPPPAVYALPPAGAARVPSSSPKAPRKPPPPPPSDSRRHTGESVGGGGGGQTRDPSPATIYHHPHPHPQVICLTPPVQPAEQVVPAKPQQLDNPSVPCFPMPPTTQRKMLLDPATGQYYLVDTPVQPARKRLFDPETGQYVDVPMPQQPMAPVSVPVSPMAINPGTYGTTYMIYPGFLPTPAMLPTLQTQLSHPESDCGETDKTSQQVEPHYIESPYYFPTGKSLNPTQTLTSQHITTRVSKGFSEGKPVISIGPRIVAPPSFDGTTMSFVVEHR
ncbi:uncharacterized protein C4orf54 homolog [Heptranchias perlo]|uniref:uncharacterized protein C4orf54 homolog n=1 Tax=Heptranchias perlo TaxID=212740 RepID=UPI0035598F84